MKVNKTERGFALVEFEDYNGENCSLQKSSIATEDCIWLGITNVNPQIMASQAEKLGVKSDVKTGWIKYPIPSEVLLSSRMHLTREQVAELIPILRNFVKTGKIQ